MSNTWSTPKRLRYTVDTLEQAEKFAKSMREAGHKDVEVKPFHRSGVSVYWTEETTD